MDERSKAERRRKRLRHQAALDLRDVLKTLAGRRLVARLLQRAGTYRDAPDKLARGRRLFGLELERDVLRVAGDGAVASLRHLILTELAPDEPPEIVHPSGDSSDS